MGFALTTLFCDMNAFFASVEQQTRPELRGCPVAVVPMQVDTTCCIAVSYEARRFGVKTGSGVREALKLCPELVLAPARVGLYVRIHHEILAAADTCIPVGTVHSIDEFSCRLIGEEGRLENAVDLAHRMKRAIRQRVGEHLRCSIGIAPNRFLGKVASNMDKPDGLTVIEAQDLPGKLHALSLTDLPGIGPRMGDRLGVQGITSVEELCRLSEDDLAEAWGSVVGRSWWRWLRGMDTAEIPTPRRSISHQHVLPPALRSNANARAVAIRLLHKAAARSRQLRYWAQRMDITVRFLNGSVWKANRKFPECQDAITLTHMLTKLWDRKPEAPALLVCVCLSKLVSHRFSTIPLFAEARRRGGLSAVMDTLNIKHGRDTVYFGAVHNVRDSAPTRIAFQNIPDPSLPEMTDAFDQADEDISLGQ